MPKWNPLKKSEFFSSFVASRMSYKRFLFARQWFSLISPTDFILRLKTLHWFRNIRAFYSLQKLLSSALNVYIQLNNEWKKAVKQLKITNESAETKFKCCVLRIYNIIQEIVEIIQISFEIIQMFNLKKKYKARNN